MIMNKNIFALITCFAMFNLQAQDNDVTENDKQPLVTINITATVVSPSQAMMILSKHAIQNPLELIHHLIAERFDDFMFTINGVTYIVQADNDLPVSNQPATPESKIITTTITAHLVSPAKAAAIIAGAAAMFFAENFTGDPTKFVQAIFAQSHNGFMFTIDNITYIIQS